MDVHSKLKKLNKLDVELTQYQPDNLPNNLFENYLTHREEILDHYGLPYADEFTKLLELGNKVLTDYEIEAVVTKMRHAAISYLTSPVRTDLDELQNAYENKKTPFEVLPKIGIETHTYTIFIYNQYLLRGRDSIESTTEAGSGHLLASPADGNSAACGGGGQRLRSVGNLAVRQCLLEFLNAVGEGL
ncbi:MAG: hypothetical protein IH947_00525, partial [Bacteroidetes bacterium]|nr:hypothetical protein [Bacteroidota bacterium]